MRKGVEYDTASSDRQLTAAEVGERGAAFVVLDRVLEIELHFAHAIVRYNLARTLRSPLGSREEQDAPRACDSGELRVMLAALG